MSLCPLYKVNSFKEKYKFHMDEEKKNILLSLDKNSIFLKKIIIKKEKDKEKEKERNNSSKLYKTVILNKNEMKKMNMKEKLSHGNLKKAVYYQSPLNKPKKEKIIVFNKELNGIKSLDINFGNISNRNELYSYSSKNTINNLNYVKPISVTRNILNSPTNLKSRPNSFRNNIVSETEPNKYILNINGQKIFSTPSFTNLTDRNRVLSSSRLDSELYRNYHELKLKEEEISKRKNKKNKENNSEEQKIRKDKRIDEKVLNVIYNNRNKDKKIFHNGKKDLKINVIKNNFIYNNKYSKNVIPLKTVQDNKTRNKVNKNLLFFKDKKSTDNIKVNNNIIDKKLTENINSNRFNNYINNSCFSKNIYFSPKTSYNNINSKKQLSSNNILKKGNNKSIKIPIQNKINGKIQITDRFFVKKKFVEDHLSDSIPFTENQKLTVKIHCLHNCNQIFHKKTKTRQKLKIQKIMNIFLSKNIGLYLDYLINNNIPIIDLKKMKNDKFLSSINEEEEKSRIE